MPPRASSRREDVTRFALPDAGTLVLAAVHLAAVRLRLGDGRDATDPAGVGTIAILSFAALAGFLPIAFARQATLAPFLSLVSGRVLIIGVFGLLTPLVPQACEAMGPAAPACLHVIFASVAAIPSGLLLRLVLHLVL